MTRHTASRSPRPGSRALLRAGLALTVAGAALGAGSASAAAVPTPLGDVDGASAVQALVGAARSATAGGLNPARTLQLDPLANTSVDPLNNSLGTQVADFKPLTTAVATGPLARGASLDDLPVVGPATGLLAG
ncbi:hypothetical protein [Streptomyces alboniger]|uniref:ATP-binding protein n=1 Tax=Streptomyces alboniger TaxID=132473 RepID=A0A5J6HS69_STRAD|nr:hypothetical protein [Streptomyces alboniger]QEV19827.1 hypothetical protein CP975_22010 [Streptomyces alboniger]